MKTIIKPVYYCEACGKHGLTKAIERHEKSCTLNPDRECNLCDRSSGYLRPLLDDYQSRFILFEFRPADFTGRSISEDAWGFDTRIIPIYREPLSIDLILGDVDNCPICTLAVIRTLGLTFWKVWP